MNYFTAPKQYGPKTEGEVWFDELVRRYNKYLKIRSEGDKAEIANIIRGMEIERVQKDKQ